MGSRCADQPPSMVSGIPDEIVRENWVVIVVVDVRVCVGAGAENESAVHLLLSIASFQQHLRASRQISCKSKKMKKCSHGAWQRITPKDSPAKQHLPRAHMFKTQGDK